MNLLILDKVTPHIISINTALMALVLWKVPVADRVSNSRANVICFYFYIVPTARGNPVIWYTCYSYPICTACCTRRLEVIARKYRWNVKVFTVLRGWGLGCKWLVLHYTLNVLVSTCGISSGVLLFTVMKSMSKHVMQFGKSVNYQCTRDQMGQLMIPQYLWHLRMRPL